MTDIWIAPDACTLPSIQQPFRVAEFDALFESYVVQLDQLSPTHVRMVLTGPEGLADKVQDLADRETACCSFFTFTLVTSHDRGGRETVQLEIEVPTEHTGVLAAFVQRAVVRP